MVDHARSFEWAEFRKAARWGEPVLRRVKAPKQKKGLGNIMCKIINPTGQLIEWGVRAEARLRKQPAHARGQFQLLNVRMMSSGNVQWQSSDAEGEQAASQSGRPSGEGAQSGNSTQSETSATV